MKVESLVIANQHVAVNLYLGLVHTARHMPEVNFTLKKKDNLRMKIFESLFSREKLVTGMKS